MLFSVMPMAISVLIGFMLWVSDLSIWIKLICTIALMIQYILFCIARFHFGVSFMRYIGISICLVLNMTGVVYFSYLALWNLVGLFVFMLVLEGIWCYGALFSFEKGGD